MWEIDHYVSYSDRNIEAVELIRYLSSLSAFNSFSPVRITEQDLQQLVIDEDIDPSLSAVIASFGSLPRPSELGYSCASTRADEDGSYSAVFLRPDSGVNID